MSNSSKLRKTQKEFGGGRHIFSSQAKKLEANVSNTVKGPLIENLKNKFPNISLRHSFKIEKLDIARAAGKLNWKPCSKSPFIKPDGGVLYATILGVEYPILVTEAKKQGTNDILLLEGKKKQAKGNAIERAVKNHAECSTFFKPYNYYPYILFASGCDFERTSSINDRLDTMTDYEPRNKEYIFHPDKLATIWIREKIWTPEEIYNKLYSICVKVINGIYCGKFGEIDA